jgi:aspartate racemase
VTSHDGTERQQIVGILGGMGPDATVELMRRIIRSTPAADDADHIRMLVDNNPKVPSRIKALIEGTGDDPGPVLVAMARGLETAGADFLAIACNTAHYYLPLLRAAVSIPILDMIGLTIARVQALGPARQVGLLASPAVRRTGLFDGPCQQAGLSLLHPAADDLSEILRIIRAVKARDLGAKIRRYYQDVAGRLIESGADTLIVACTELSALGLHCLTVPVTDTMDALVEEICVRCSLRRSEVSVRRCSAPDRLANRVRDGG